MRVCETSETDELRPVIATKTSKLYQMGDVGRRRSAAIFLMKARVRDTKGMFRWIVMKREIDQSILIVDGRLCPVRIRAGP